MSALAWPESSARWRARPAVTPLIPAAGSLAAGFNVKGRTAARLLAGLVDRFEIERDRLGKVGRVGWSIPRQEGSEQQGPERLEGRLRHVGQGAADERVPMGGLEVHRVTVVEEQRQL
ncbi:MAG: hypothetical protein H8E31_11270 [Planctomycetes bacterium]|nr:hypothetical protein [Planctomycetota bacterium]